MHIERVDREEMAKDDFIQVSEAGNIFIHSSEYMMIVCEGADTYMIILDLILKKDLEIIKEKLKLVKEDAKIAKE